MGFGTPGLARVALVVFGLWVAGVQPVVAADGAGATAGAQSIPPEIPTSIFAGRTEFGRARISPDGKKIALVVFVNGDPNLVVMDVATKKFSERTAIGNSGYQLEWFRWAGNGRILVSLSGTTTIYGDDYRYTRLYVLDLATGIISYVGTKTQGLEGDNVLYVDPNGQYVVLQLQHDVFTEPEVRRLPLDGSNTDHDEQVQKRYSDVWNWVADNDGVVRVGLRVRNGKIQLLYRKSADDKYQTIAKFSGDEAEDKTQLYAALKIIGGSDEGLTLDKGPSGKVALRRVNYETGEGGDVVYENKDWDVTDFEIDPEGRPVAAYYTDDRDRVAWLDPAMAETQKNLEKALHGKEVWIFSRANDDSRMLVWSGGANDPGAYYVYTPAKQTLDLLAEARPGLPLDLLATVTPVSYDARDGTKIHAYLTLPPGRDPKGLPLIILPHGGPYGVRDKLDYDDQVQLLANRGYAVLQPNYRGSSGYGEDFEKLGDGQIGRAMQDDLDDAMDWAVAQGIADGKRVCVVGSSYGGYAAIWAVIRNPERYRCAASFAGVTDWGRQLKYDGNFFSGKDRKAWQSRVRGDDKKFDLDRVSPAKEAARLTQPILLAQGKLDSNVPYSQFKVMRRAIEEVKFDKVEYLIFDEEGHGFDTSDDEQKWYDTLVAFLEENNPS